MSVVRTREEALTLVDAALAKFDNQVCAVLTQAYAVTRSEAQRAESVVKRCANKVGALMTLLTAAQEEDRRRLQAELTRAHERLDQARRAAKRVADVSEGVRALQRSYAQQSSPIVAAGRGYLAGRMVAVQQYLTVAAGASSGGGSTGGPGVSGPSTALDSLGMTSISVAAADLDSNPILDGFTRGGLSRGDYRWAVQTWNDIVGPGVARGMTRDDFVARDNGEPPAPPLRRTTDVYDLFLGGDPIRADRQPDGSLNIVSGRHRLQIARELGISHLPGKVFG